MADNSKKVIDFYVRANSNKYVIAKKDKNRDYSLAEITVLAALDALFRHEFFATKDDDWDVNKTIRIIFADSLRNKMHGLSKEDEYYLLLNKDSKESLMAKSSLAKTMFGLKTDNDDFNELMDNFSKLRETPRIGHILWGAKTDRYESVLEHIYGTIILMMGIESEYGFELDYDEIITMLLIHEAEEIKKGDEPDLHVPHDQKLGKRIVEEIFAKVPNRKKYTGLIDKFNAHSLLDGDISSEYAHLSDKMEYLLQVRLNDLRGLYDFEHRPENAATLSPRVQEIIASGVDNVFDVHYEFDKYRFQSFPAMKRILEQAKNLQY